MGGNYPFGWFLRANPRNELISRLKLFAVSLIRSEFAQADLRESCVVHQSRPSLYALVLDVARAAALNVRVKRCRLARKQILVVGVADYTIRGFDSPHGSMAGGAVVL